jgi:phospholipid/cholesterol/gamma-HCH transport system substrate-binding protein
MSPYRRNVFVGITVLGGLIGLSTMLLKFGGSSIRLFRGGHQVEVEFSVDRSDGLSEGGGVEFLGMPVGSITSIRRDAGDEHVIIDALIDNTPPLPGNVTGYIRTKSFVSGISVMSLELRGVDIKPIGKLVEGQKIPALFVGSDLIPPEFTEDIRYAGAVLKGLDVYVNDPKIHTDIQASLDNFRHISESVQKSANNVEHFSDGLQKVGTEAASTLADAHATVLSAQADVEHLSRQIDDRMLQISKSLEAFQAVTSKINNGQGTAGLLVNDPKLYQSLVDNSKELNLTIADLRRLVEQWEQEGVSFKLK